LKLSHAPHQGAFSRDRKNDVMEELLTIDCKSIVRRLLRNQPHLAAWTDVCDIYIDKFGNHFSTCLIIDCRYEALASFFIQNTKALLEPIAKTSPIPVRIIYEDSLIAAYLPLLELSPNEGATGLTMVTTTLQQAQTNNQQAIIESIGLNQIPTSMQDLVIEQVASLGLPVTLDNKGGYKLPQTTFNIAWQEIGNAVWRQEFGAIAEPAPIADNGVKPTVKPTTPAKPATNRASAKNETPRALLMREKLKPEDDIVTTGRNAAKLTLDNLLAKVSTKHYSREQILESIINQNEHGLKLLEKLYEAYAKRDGIYKVRPQEWAKTKAKVVDECRKILNPPQEQAPEESVTQEAETTAE
jgi:hypothetical protein